MNRLIFIALTVLLTACSGMPPILPLIKPGPNFTAEVLASAKSGIAQQWVASTDSLPHGASAAGLEQWWRQLGDPVLVELIESAQKASATSAQAALRVAEARGSLTVVDAAAIPSLDATLSQSRAAFTFGGPVALRTQIQAQLQSSWEIDLFGRRYREREAALARASARVADWHEGRVSVAAELANSYVQYRFCEQQIAVLAADAQSRVETSRLTDLASNAGFQPPATAAVLRASAADARRRLIVQKGDCAIAIKSMVALTAMPESVLVQKLKPGTAQLPTLALFQIDRIPAQQLMQRPDLWAAELDLAAASADIGGAQAARYPRLSLLGSIGPLRFVSGGTTINATTWSFGPSLSTPLFDGGKSLANIEVAKAGYAAALAAYRAKTYNAVKEVEQALVQIAIANERRSDTQIAAQGFKDSLNSSNAKWRAGIGSLLELEDARRQSLSADVELGILKRDLLLAWVGLYRAIGGGWAPG